VCTYMRPAGPSAQGTLQAYVSSLRKSGKPNSNKADYGASEKEQNRGQKTRSARVEPRRLGPTMTAVSSRSLGTCGM
jgi:hypothetical protein